MAWNEPGGNQDNQNPWGRGNKPDSTSDFQKFLQEFKKHLQQLSAKAPQKGPVKFQKIRQLLTNYGHYVVPAVIVGGWILAGITVVDSGQQAVVLKLGKFDRTLKAGIHWSPPLVEKVLVIPQQQINAVPYTGSVLTQDNDVITFTINVQYHIADPKIYLFNVADPAQRLQDAVAASIYQVISKQSINNLLDNPKQDLNQELMSALTNQLQIVSPGVKITDVSIQSLDVPAAVTDAYTDSKQAAQDSQLVIKQANDSAAQVMSQVKAQVAQQMSEAKAYQQKVVLKAQSDTVRYLALLPEYQQNPQVTRERLYIDTMQHVLNKVTKVIVDVPSNGQVQVNLPLTTLPSNTMPATVTAAPSAGSATTAAGAQRDTDGIAGYGSDNAANAY